MKETKMIPDPVLGPVDITPVVDIVDHELFQRLRYRKQLGICHLFFPGATHTRFEHSLGAYKRTTDRMTRWLQAGLVTEQEATDVAIFALTHDIGHGPLSHLIEPLCSINHDQRGLKIISKLKGAIVASGGNFKNIQAIFAHKNPLYLAVHDKNLGTEKFDYLERDAYHTGYGQKPGVANLNLFVSFHKGQVVIDPRAIDEAIQIQKFYLQMYKNVYMRKGAATLHRMFQKMVGGLIASGLPEDRLWSMTDDDLMVEFRNAKKKWIRDYDEKFLKRELPKVAISLKLEKYLDREDLQNYQGKHTVFGITEKIADLLSRVYREPAILEKTEEKLAQLSNLPPLSILLVPVVDPQRFIPQDIKIFTRKGLASLKERRSDHFDDMAETAKSYATIRVATFPEFRKRLAHLKVAQKLIDYLISNAKDLNTDTNTT